jgi:probable HAF family extracellular repeat protein
MSQHQQYFLIRASLKLIASLLIPAMSLVGGVAHAQTPTYRMVELATLSQGSTAVVVRGPNSAGLAWGGGKRADGSENGRRGLLLRGGNAMEQLPGLPESDDAVVFGANDAEAFVGASNTANALRAFAGTPAGGVRELPPLPDDTASVAFAVNIHNQAAGYSSGATGQRAVIWDANGTPAALPVTPAMSDGRATGINARGDVSGVVQISTVQRPVLWPGGHVPRELLLLAGHATGEANAVNARGDAVGYSAPASGARRATLWPSGGGVVDLGMLPGGDFSQAFDSNDAGVVVGTSTSEAGGRAFVWTRNGGMQDLNALVPPSSFVLTKAVGINNVGMIVATGHEVPAGLTAAGHTHDEEHDLPVRVFLLVRQGGGQ